MRMILLLLRLPIPGPEFASGNLGQCCSKASHSISTTSGVRSLNVSACAINRHEMNRTRPSFTSVIMCTPRLSHLLSGIHH